ncbi:lytic transglycosylase [Pseudomonas phage vB_PsyP_3MF5]|uniref:internal virion protein with endolysin domain n=1 Tax=Pseudomonas phage vB_PsyP_3MF5 TaxID=2749426 RepID=UPI001BD9DB22|nr:internal virion protein with endolysin domain [Pseudomonas phage vB_PsyP_3MF5]QLI47592.1 lytic transglycosylase [Pseudomonas phage vB_PsyP_3MF5]
MKDQGYAKVKAEGSPFDSLIQTASARYGVPYDLLHKQIYKESSFNPNAVSPTGPRGLAQMTKATGLAYGLERDEDFFNPEKSVDAAARHMRDNIKIAGGDELKALLLYNQGGGKVGRKQIEAYDRGDFTGVSEEGLNYMRSLMDVTNTGKKAELDAFVKPDGGYEAPAGIEAQSKVATEDPQDGPLASFEIAGKDIAPKATPFAQTLYETTGKTEDKDRGFFEGAGNNASVGLRTSVLGMMIRSVTEAPPEADFMQTYTAMKDIFNDPFEMGRLSDWTDEDYDKLRSSGLNPQYYDVVLRGYRRNFDQNLAMALENQRMEETTKGDRLGASLAGGLGSALGDPYSLVNPGKGAAGGLGSRILGGAIAGGAIGGMSEHSAAKASGREEHLGMAIAGGAAFGGVLNGLLGARPSGRNSWDTDTGPAPLEGELLGPEPTPPGLPNGYLRIERGPIEGELGQAQLPNPDAQLKGTIGRLTTREQARQKGLNDDPAAMPFREGEEIKKSPAGDYLDVPFDADAARTLDGAIHSGGSPINPKTVEAFTELNGNPKAAFGATMGGLTEIGLKLGRSNSEEMRSVARDLFRSSTGYTDGSNGKFGPTASDIAERLRSQDHTVHLRLSEGFDEALKDPFWRAQNMSEGARREAISRRVVEALEADTPAKLTPPEMKLLDELRKHMNQKWDYISNPAQFGDLRAKALLEDTRHFSTYFPQRYSREAKLQALQRFGGEEGLQDAIVHSWMASYVSRPKVRQRVDAMIQEGFDKANKGNPQAKPMTPEQLQAAVEKYARDKAYGISHSNQFTANSLVEEHLKDGAGLENNDYLEARNLFDSDMQIPMPDGGMFSVNDLRDFNLLRVVPQYDRRVNGDIAIMGGTGKTTRELKNLANGMRQKAMHGKASQEADALMDALKMLTGRARRDPDNAWATAARALTDLGFFSKNAYMGAQNLTEIASMVVKGHQRMLLKGIPLLKQWTTKDARLAPEDIKDLHGLMFGKELDDIIRPSRQDIVDSLRQNSSEFWAQTMGTIKYGTQELAARSPFTWLLRESGNYILDAGRQGALVDLIDHTLNGKVTDLFSPERLRSASISPEQFKGIQDLIRAHFKQDRKSGKWRIENPEGLASDVRSMDLYRLGDRVADETMLRPHKMSYAPSKQYGAGWAMALQFKMFVLRSLNGRVMRGWMEATKNGQALDQVMQAVISVGLATAFYAGSVHLKALGMPERARKDYKEKALSPSMLAYAAISRSSSVGSPLGASNYITAPFGFDSAAMVRTSILPREKRQERSYAVKYNPLSSDMAGDAFGRIAEQVPAANVAANLAIGLGYNGYQLATGDRSTDDLAFRTGIWNALKQFVPNDPATQSLMQRLAEQQGVERQR